jgi:hypothetical protein
MGPSCAQRATPTAACPGNLSDLVPESVGIAMSIFERVPLHSKIDAVCVLGLRSGRVARRTPPTPRIREGCSAGNLKGCRAEHDLLPRVRDEHPPKRFASGTPDRGKAQAEGAERAADRGAPRLTSARSRGAPRSWSTGIHRGNVVRRPPMLQCNIKRPGPTRKAGRVVVIRLTLSGASGTLTLLARAVPNANRSRKSSPICGPDDAYRRTYEDGR